jgi:uncharacterized membrane protein required for colicin V production
MNFFDPLLAIIFLSFVVSGFINGLVYTFGSLVGIFVGVFLAGEWYLKLAHLAGNYWGGKPVVQIIAFVILFLFISRLVGLIFRLVNKVVKVIPGLSFLNRLAGLALGAIEGAFFIGISLQFISRLAPGTFFENLLVNSEVSKFFISISGFIVPLLPEAVKQLRSIMTKS